MSGIDCFLGWIVIWDGFSWDEQGLLNIIQSRRSPLIFTWLRASSNESYCTLSFYISSHFCYLLFITNCAIHPMLLTKTIESTYCRLFFCHQCNSTALGTCTKYYNFRFRCYGRLTQRNTRHLQHTGDVFPWQQLQNHSQGR